jgi:hypothetical protein
MEYRENYMTAKRLAEKIRQSARGKRRGLASKDEGQSYQPFEPGRYMSMVQQMFADDIGTDSISSYLDSDAPTSSPRPVARDDEAPETSPRPVSRGAEGTSETGRRLFADLQEELGLTPEQAAGLVGNLEHETGRFKFMQEIDPMVEGSRGGFGFAQWTGDRRVAFENWAEKQGLDPSSYEANKGYLIKELTERDDIIQSIGINSLEKLRQAESAEDAAEIVSKEYLRPGKPNLSSRIRFAQIYSELDK